VLDTWTLDRVALIRRHWRECGPPTHIGIAALAAAWGAKITSDPKPIATEKPVAIDLSDGVLRDIAMPVAGGDTMAASVAVLAKLKSMNGG
jgi:hypothetical protein